MFTYNEVVTYAATMPRKPTKQDAKYILHDIAERGGMATVDQCAQLYALLVPQKTTGKKLTPFQWVALACADKKDNRDYLRYVYVTESHITGCDGHRMHRIANTEQLQTGYYLPNGDRAHDLEWNTYPDVVRIIPDIQKCDPVDLNNPTYGEERGWPFARLTNGRAFNRKYLEQAMSGFPECFTAYQIDNDEPILIEQGDRLAVVMGMRI